MKRRYIRTPPLQSGFPESAEQAQKKIDSIRSELLTISCAALPAIIETFPNYSPANVANAAISYADAVLDEIEKRGQNEGESEGET